MSVSSRVLIVEDDASLLRGLSDNFRAAGYEVLTATDGPSGLAHALGHPPDLILLDIMLPRLNGYDLCRQVRQAKLEVPILMLTAKGQEEEIVRGLELGADDYMTKPFGIRELLARARRLIRRQSVPATDTFTIGDAVFDRISQTLKVDGNEVPLTNKEYRLLDYFVSHPHRALTRHHILDHVWGRSIMVSPRSVDRCVTTLRSKIEPNPSQPQFIRTIRDVGYRFECS